MYIAGISQAILELSFEVRSENYQRGISFRNFRYYEYHFTENVTFDKSQFPNIKIEIFFKPWKI